MKLIAIILGGLLILSMPEKKVKSDLERQGLKGNVARIFVCKYSVVRTKRGYEKNNLVKRDTYMYDLNGNLTTENGDIGDNSYGDAYNNNEVYKHDNLGRLIEASGTGPYGGPCTSTYKYDSSNNQVEQYNKWAVMRSISKSKFEYDTRGNKIKEFDYNNNIKVGNGFGYSPEPDDLYDIITFRYDENGFVQQERHFHPYDSAAYSITYKYGAIEAIDYNTYMDYNRPGGLIYTYSFNRTNCDAHGNWLTRTKFQNGTPQEIEERQITYFTLDK